MMAVIGSMAAILVHERKRIREIEAGTETIRQVRRDISEASAGTKRTTAITMPSS